MKRLRDLLPAEHGTRVVIGIFAVVWVALIVAWVCTGGPPR